MTTTRPRIYHTTHRDIVSARTDALAAIGVRNDAVTVPGPATGTDGAPTTLADWLLPQDGGVWSVTKIAEDMSRYQQGGPDRPGPDFTGIVILDYEHNNANPFGILDIDEFAPALWPGLARAIDARHQAARIIWPRAIIGTFNSAYGDGVSARRGMPTERERARAAGMLELARLGAYRNADIITTNIYPRNHETDGPDAAGWLAAQARAGIGLAQDVIAATTQTPSGDDPGVPESTQRPLSVYPMSNFVATAGGTGCPGCSVAPELIHGQIAEAQAAGVKWFTMWGEPPGLDYVAQLGAIAAPFSVVGRRLKREGSRLCRGGSKLQTTECCDGSPIGVHCCGLPVVPGCGFVDDGSGSPVQTMDATITVQAEGTGTGGGAFDYGPVVLLPDALEVAPCRVGRLYFEDPVRRQVTSRPFLALDAPGSNDSVQSCVTSFRLSGSQPLFIDLFVRPDFTFVANARAGAVGSAQVLAATVTPLVPGASCDFGYLFDVEAEATGLFGGTITRGRVSGEVRPGQFGPCPGQQSSNAGPNNAAITEHMDKAGFGRGCCG